MPSECAIAISKRLVSLRAEILRACHGNTSTSIKTRDARNQKKTLGEKGVTGSLHFVSERLGHVMVSVESPMNQNGGA